MTCTACERAHTTDCDASFVCSVCFDRKNTCHSKVGGFDGPKNICDLCHMREHGIKQRPVPESRTSIPQRRNHVTKKARNRP